MIRLHNLGALQLGVGVRRVDDLLVLHHRHGRETGVSAKLILDEDVSERAHDFGLLMKVEGKTHHSTRR